LARPSRVLSPVDSAADETVVRPFLKWAGGKTRVVPLIRRRLGTVPGGRLVEPFVGSGAVCLNFPRFRRLLLADANADLVGHYRHVADRVDELVDEGRRLFVSTNNERAACFALREEFNSSPAFGLRRAALFVYLNRHGFNGLCRYNSKGGFNVPFGRHATVGFPEEEIRRFHDRPASADEVRIEHADFRQVMRDELRAGDVVCADPPYVPLGATASFTTYAEGGFGHAEQLALAQAAHEAAGRGIPVLLSNHDTPVVRDLYAGAEVESFPVRHSISRDGDNRAAVAEVLALMRPERA
jgi:DNA adenine methylase